MPRNPRKEPFPGGVFGCLMVPLVFLIVVASASAIAYEFGGDGAVDIVAGIVVLPFLGLFILVLVFGWKGRGGTSDDE